MHLQCNFTSALHNVPDKRFPEYIYIPTPHFLSLSLATFFIPHLSCIHICVEHTIMYYSKYVPVCMNRKEESKVESKVKRPFGKV